MRLEKMFETHVKFFRKKYHPSYTKRAEYEAIDDLKEIRFGKMEYLKKEYADMVESLMACSLMSLVLVIQLIICFIMKEILNLPSIWPFYKWIWGAEAVITIFSFIDYSLSEKEMKLSNNLKIAFLLIGGASGLATIFVIVLFLMLTFSIGPKKKEAQLYFENEPPIYCLFIKPYMKESLKIQYLEDCKAYLIELNNSQEYEANKIIKRELDKLEKERQKKEKKYKDRKETAFAIMLSVFFCLCFIPYIGYRHGFASPNRVMNAFIFLILAFIITRIIYRKNNKKYLAYKNQQLGVPEIYKVYFDEVA